MLFSSSSRGKLRLAGSPELVPGAAFPRLDSFLALLSGDRPGPVPCQRCINRTSNEISQPQM